MKSFSPILISVVIPTYNRAGYIGDTIQSVLKQQYTNFELIIVDDGSTDNTEAVVFSFKDDRIKYFKKSNAERAAARNFGVQKANGSYITFLDSDDLLKSNHLSEAIDFINENADAVIFHLGYNVIQPNGTIIYPWKALPDPVNEKLVEGNFLSCLGIFAKHDVLLQYPFNEDRELSGSEDYELWIRLAARYPIRTRAVVTASLVNHETRSVLQIDVTKFLKRIALIKRFLNEDSQVTTTYGSKTKTIFAYLDLYAALHLVMAGFRAKAWKFLLGSLFQQPSVIFNYRFLVVVKKIILF
ncbi:glycosyltransferase family 2 protein [Ohtaekwangia koreensis]|uniref:Glycosyltransferase involved in cell wall bisynthesis n=1 Tax=Ohtaekwangia koreensis TaxID=688867 RepID=A0A1T5LMH7_9BACT|nr:glycosyltransferase [Ohtaekwangia koreensis]SKC77243.1 Glycosyltransferase involved in cell wall bisynthesis [Ohtaekwangia koreensis]